jgi:hypothetical protein
MTQYTLSADQAREYATKGIVENDATPVTEERFIEGVFMLILRVAQARGHCTCVNFDEATLPFKNSVSTVMRNHGYTVDEEFPESIEVSWMS